MASLFWHKKMHIQKSVQYKSDCMIHIETEPMFDAFMLDIPELSQRSGADSIGMTAEIWDFF